MSIVPALPAPSLASPQLTRGTLQRPLESTSTEEKFLEYARMTPAERMRAAILEEMGLTEEELETMDSKARAAVEDNIREAIKEKVEGGLEKATGALVDILA